VVEDLPEAVVVVAEAVDGRQLTWAFKLSGNLSEALRYSVGVALICKSLQRDPA